MAYGDIGGGKRSSSKSGSRVSMPRAGSSGNPSRPSNRGGSRKDSAGRTYQGRKVK
jgi:hypothetical protein